MAGAKVGPADAITDRYLALDEIQRRVLWLATNMIHHANKVRPNASGLKVGGHQASSSSCVSILTELFFDFMEPGDRISVKPHASPVLHAIHYLLGNLDRPYLTELRAYHGLQAYPSRTKDPDPVDFSTGSVGLGSIAPNFAALVDKYARSHFGVSRAPARWFSLLGDAELDEGSIWEAVAEPALAGLAGVIWIVDMNRQSLDRVVPGIRVRQLEEMFRANGWAVFEAKYGRSLEAAFAAPRGEELRAAIDQMPNELYQLLLRAPVERIAEVLGDATPDVPDDELRGLISDLGGHDLAVLRSTLDSALAAGRPAVVFAYTIKGWGLSFAGDPLNHSALIGATDLARLRESLGIPIDDDWALLDPDSSGGRLVAARASALKVATCDPTPLATLPAHLGLSHRGLGSTQDAFGRVLTELTRSAPQVAARLVTVSPDVATSTNLAGWINKVGVWEAEATTDLFMALGPRLISWKRQPSGQHIELGISETNLLMLLGQLGLSAEMNGQPLLPIGTVYDPFVARALDAYIYGVYSGSRFILVGTPSGVSLAPEGGAHQSVVTPSIGVALPGVIYWEPCFAQELEWILLHALEQLHAKRPTSTYLRLSTLGIDQSLFPDDDAEQLRSQVLTGSYVIRDYTEMSRARPGNRVEIWATGVTVVSAIHAAEELVHDGVYARVVNCVSPGLIHTNWHQRVRQAILDLRKTRSDERRMPVVTVIDGHPSSLSWVGSMLGVPAFPLGVSDFGQSGLPDELHRHFGIDAESISYAAYVALEA
jgi:pyruvate dehydrogenase E1 component